MNKETFDIISYEKTKTEQLGNDMENPWTVITTSLNGDKIELYSSTNGKEITYFKSITPPEPALLKTIKRFHSNGKIAVEYETFIGTLNPYPNSEYTLVGETKYFDKDGILVKSEDNERLFENKQVNLIKLFSILEKEPLLDNLSIEEKEKLKNLFFKERKMEEITVNSFIKFLKENFYKNLENQGIKHNYNQNNYFLNKDDKFDRFNLEISYNNKNWIIKKDYYPLGWISLEIDASTKKIIEKKYHFEDRP